MKNIHVYLFVTKEYRTTTPRRHGEPYSRRCGRKLGSKRANLANTNGGGDRTTTCERMNGGDTRHLQRILPRIGVVVNKIGTDTPTRASSTETSAGAITYGCVVHTAGPREWSCASRHARHLLHVPLNSRVILQLTIGRR